MARPIYEKESDRAKEQEVIDQIERRWAAKVDYVIQLPKMSSADIAMVQDNKIVAFGEIKSRNVELATYKTLYLSVQKSAMLWSIAQVTNKPMFIFGNYTDCIAYTRMKAGWPCSFGGRTDRNDSADQEALMELPTDLFQILHTKGEK